jgi:serine/threonine protein kinase
LDDYVIIREIGRGGTAIVYEAYHKSLRRKVALKQLPVAATLDPRWQERFQNEVRATSQLSHPNIVPFYELGADETHFYTMQLINGVSLAEVIRRLRQCREGIRPCMNRESDEVHPAFLKMCERCRCRFACHPAESNGKPNDLSASPEYQGAVVELMCDAALAVQYAHEQGILHLDIKPSNILVDTEGKVWITDFGAARSNDDTASAVLTGTLCYMSPEQLDRDDKLDARSDVYSLGATLYELLTLERPFGDDAPHALVAQVSIGTVIDAGTVNEKLPSKLSTIINKAMERDQDRRHSTVADLSDDLEAYFTPPTQLTIQEKRATARFGRIAAAMLAMVVLVAIFVVAPWRSSFPTTVYEWNGHFYALTESELDWESAEAEAVSHGGHLITINSKEEQAFVEKTFLTPPDSVFWIGLTDAAREGDWRWVSGEPVEYTNWENRGEPNNVLWKDADTGETIDEDYGVINWHFIVERPRRHACTWNDISSARNDDRITPHRGIMEFGSDPR